MDFAISLPNKKAIPASKKKGIANGKLTRMTYVQNSHMSAGFPTKIDMRANRAVIKPVQKKKGFELKENAKIRAITRMSQYRFFA